jgi:hypothetical protein
MIVLSNPLTYFSSKVDTGDQDEDEKEKVIYDEESESLSKVERVTMTVELNVFSSC